MNKPDPSSAKISGAQMGGNGAGYDGKIYVSRGQCGADYFAPISVVDVTGGVPRLTRKDCQDITPIELATSDVFRPQENPNVLGVSGQVHVHEIPNQLLLTGRTWVIPHLASDVSAKDRLLVASDAGLLVGVLAEKYLRREAVLVNEDGTLASIDTSRALVAVARLSGSTNPQLIFQNGRSLYRRELKGNVLGPIQDIVKPDSTEVNMGGSVFSRPTTLRKANSFLPFSLSKGDVVIGAGDFLGYDYDQILLQSASSELKVVGFNGKMMADSVRLLYYIYANGYDTAVVQNQGGTARFLGMGKLKRGGKPQSFRRVDEILEVPVDDSRVADAGNGNLVVELKNKPILSLRPSQNIIAIADLDDDDRSEILFEENGSIQMLRVKDQNMIESLTIGNLVFGGK